MFIRRIGWSPARLARLDEAHDLSLRHGPRGQADDADWPILLAPGCGGRCGTHTSLAMATNARPCPCDRHHEHARSCGLGLRRTSPHTVDAAAHLAHALGHAGRTSSAYSSSRADIESGKMGCSRGLGRSDCTDGSRPTDLPAQPLEPERPDRQLHPRSTGPLSHGSRHTVLNLFPSRHRSLHLEW